MSAKARDEWGRDFIPTSEPCLLAEEEAKGGVIRVMKLLGIVEDPDAIWCSYNLFLSCAVRCEP
jgi:hypothetical protein